MVRATASRRRTALVLLGLAVALCGLFLPRVARAEATAAPAAAVLAPAGAPVSGALSSDASSAPRASGGGAGEAGAPVRADAARGDTGRDDAGRAGTGRDDAERAAAVDRAPGDGVRSAASRPGTAGPGPGDAAGAERAGPPQTAGPGGAVLSASGADDDGGAPGCHRSRGLDGALPAVRGGLAENLPLLLGQCASAPSQAVTVAGHARPPARSQAPLEPPTPVGLSVLRV